MIFCVSLPGEIGALTRISKTAFDTDISVGNTEPGGPPEYDCAAWHQRMMKSGKLYCAICDDRIIGGAVLFPDAEQKEVYIGRIFVDPAHFRKGYGIAIMEQIEKSLPGICASWTRRCGICAPTGFIKNSAIGKPAGIKKRYSMKRSCPMKHNHETNTILTDRFGKDSLIALATVEGGIPHVRTVDAVYIDGAFYVVTYSLSGKMQQIAKNPVVAVSGEWFTAHGVGDNLGHVLLPENEGIMDILRVAFAAWYGNGHTNEADPNTCLLKIKLTDGVLFADGTRYDIEF